MPPLTKLSGGESGGGCILHKTALLALLSLFLGACQTSTKVVNAPGTPTTYLDPASRANVSGVGTESQDIKSMADEMVRDMLTYPILANAQKPPRIIIDSQYFRNESSERINKNLITNKIRTALSRAARGRMAFVGRQYSSMVAKERDLKRQGTVDAATRKFTRAQAGADYRLGGTFASRDARNPRTGQITRYSQYTFEIIDLENGLIVWSNDYDFKKSAADDVIYR